MPESEGGFSPEEATRSRFNKHGEIVDPNQKPESRIHKKVAGWVAMARLGAQQLRAGGFLPQEPGKVAERLESLKERLDQAKPVDISELTGTPSKDAPTTDK